MSSITNKKAHCFINLSAVLLTNAIAHSIFMIGFPVFGRNLGLSDIQTGTILSVSAMAMMAVSLWWGKRIDQNGRTSAISAGIVSTAIFLILFYAFLPLGKLSILSVFGVFATLLVLKSVQAMSVAGLMPAAQAYITDITSAAKRTAGMGLLGTIFGIGSIIGGILAMLAGVDYFPLTLALLGVCMLIIYLGVARKMVEPNANRYRANHPINKALITLPLRKILPYLMITFCILLAYGMLQELTGLRLQDQLGYSTANALKGSGALMTTAMFFMVGGQAVIFRLSIKKPKKLLLYGLIITSIGLVLLAIGQSFLIFFLAMALAGLGVSLVLPTNLAQLSLLSNENNRAYIASCNNISKGLGLALGPGLGAWLYHYNIQLPLWVAITVALIALIFGLCSQRSKSSLKPKFN